MTNCRWQTVPHEWPGHRENSVAKFCPRTWNRVVGAGRRVEPIACWIIVAVGVCRIGQVWALMCVDHEHHQCQLELDSVHHWQPVQLPRGRISLTILSVNFTLKQYVILSLLSHGLTFAKSYALLYSSECTKTSITDETTTFLQPLRLCKKQSFFL